MPMERTKRTITRFLVLWLPLLLTAWTHSAFEVKKEPLWWEIRLVLTAEGEYRTQEGETRYYSCCGSLLEWMSKMFEYE